MHAQISAGRGLSRLGAPGIGGFTSAHVYSNFEVGQFIVRTHSEGSPAVPPLPPVTGVLRILLKQTLQADLDCLNRLFFTFSGTSTTTNLNSLAGVIAPAWHTRFSSLLSSDLSLTEVTIQDLTSSSAPMVIFPTTQNGGVGTPSVPAGSAFMFQFHIARRYRGGKPRYYQGGCPAVDLQTAQTWTATYQANMLAAMAGFTNDIIGGGSGGMTVDEQVNVSYYEGFTPVLYPSGRYKNIPKLRTGGPVIDLISEQTANPNVCSQRRRNLTP